MLSRLTGGLEWLRPPVRRDSMERYPGYWLTNSFV